MEREATEYEDIRTVTHRDSQGGQFQAIHCISTGKSMVGFAGPLLMVELTEAEAVSIVDEFAGEVAVLFVEMRARLAEMRGGQ